MEERSTRFIRGWQWSGRIVMVLDLDAAKDVGSRI